MPADQRPTNRLIDSTSPYLLQHAHNPVMWYPWGKEALEKAKAEGKPIFLSIGYAACHWCHVMEREVFEKDEIAAVMNEFFVNIKVDREERPDLDELYMLATQIMTGSGGWPMSVWLTPPAEQGGGTGGLEPFYAGTYFPAEDGYGRPGFPKLERALADAWKNRRADLEAQAARVAEAIRQHADESAATAQGAELPAIESLLDTAMDQMADRFDESHGGLGGAPKFPPHQALLLWQRMLSGSWKFQKLVTPALLHKTLDGMMNGGIYDHVGGGFARYSTDARWLVPHFEKMLYDSAQLAPVYALASDPSHRPEYARVARETLDFFMREMQNAQGAFYSSLDADSAGEEGLYYVWTIPDVHAALPEKSDADLIIEHFGITVQGNWHETPVPGGNVLAVAADAKELAQRHSGSPTEMRNRLDRLLVKMREHRANRVRPGLDDKILTAWNGLMISALAVCGRVLREPKYLEAAHRAIGFLLTHHMEGGRRLLRVSRNGHAHTDAFLDDHAYLLNGLMDLIDSTTPTSLPGTMARKRALELADTLIADFQDKEHGGFFFTSTRHETLFARMKNAADNATPSANGVAIRALLRLARVSGKEQYREVALRAVAAFGANIQRRPEYFPTILLALAEDEETATESAFGRAPLPKAGPPAVELRDDRAGLMQVGVADVDAQVGETFLVRVRVTIAPGYHIQPNEPADREVYRTLAKIRGTVELASQDWQYPPAEKFPDGTSGYSGTVELVARCSAAESTGTGRHPMRVALLAQICSGTSCLAPERVSAEFMLNIVA